MSTDDELFTPDEVLGGFSAKRARLLLFQIESRTAYLKVQSQRVVSSYLTEEAAEQQDLSFFEALLCPTVAIPGAAKRHVASSPGSPVGTEIPLCAARYSPHQAGFGIGQRRGTTSI